jgi:hypothetical protein
VDCAGIYAVPAGVSRSKESGDPREVTRGPGRAHENAENISTGSGLHIGLVGYVGEAWTYGAFIDKFRGFILDSQCGYAASTIRAGSALKSHEREIGSRRCAKR